MKYRLFFCLLLLLSSCQSHKDERRRVLTYHDNNNIWQLWYENIEGEKNGIFIQFYENGKIEYVKYYKDGLLDGNYINWYSTLNANFLTGKLKRISKYKHDVLTEYLNFDSVSGNMMNIVKLDNVERVKESLKFNHLGMIQHKVLHNYELKQAYTEDWIYFGNGKVKTFKKYWGDTAYYINSYDSISGKLLKAYRYIPYQYVFDEDSVEFRPFMPHKFDKINTYKFKIINLTKHNHSDTLCGQKGMNVFKFAIQNNMNWKYIICDSLGCYGIPITVDDTTKKIMHVYQKEWQ